MRFLLETSIVLGKSQPAGVENVSFFQFKGCFSRFLQINYTIDLNNQLIGDEY